MRYIVMAIVMLLTCLDLSTAQAAVTPGERASLAGLPGVEVVIERINPDAQADGLSEEAIRTAVELILRSNGIRVADVQLVPTPNKIKRENNSRRIDVQANVKGRDLGSVAEEVKQRLDKVQFPVGYYPQLLGEYKERQAAQRNLLIASLFVVVAIFLILHATFRNLRLATMVFIALPAALVGAVLATFAADRVISLGSLVGIITILGLSARNGIMLIEHCRYLERVENEPFGAGLVLRGASERLSPILMTTLCTALALLPLIVPGSIPGHEVEHPMAVAILGGIITSSLLSLFVVPILYLRFGANSSGKTINDPPAQSASI